MATTRLAAVSIVAMAMVTPAVAAFHSSVTSSGLLVLNRAGISPVVLYSVPTLQKWKVLKDGSVWGVVTNHPSLPDGSLMTTSPLNDPDKADADVMVQTQTGSTYKLAAPAPPVASDGVAMGALAAAVAAAILFNNIAASGPEMFTPPMLTSTDNILVANMKAPKPTQKESERKIKEDTMLKAAMMMQTKTSDERTRVGTSDAAVVPTTAETTTIVTTTKAVEDTATTKALVTASIKAVQDTAETLLANTKAVVTATTKAVEDTAETLVANTKTVVTTTSNKAFHDAISLSKQVNVAMTNNVAPDTKMAAALAMTGMAGAAAVISSYRQGGAMKRANESATLLSGDPVATKTTFSSKGLDSISSLSSAAAKSTEVTGLKPVTSWSGAAKSSVAAPVSSFAGESHLNTLSGAARSAAAAPEWSSSTLKGPASVETVSAMSSSSAWRGSSIDNMSAAAAADTPVPTKIYATSTVTSSSSSASTILNASIGGVESKAGYKPAASVGQSQVPPSVPQRSKTEVIEGLKTELDLAREFFSHNGAITPAPRPIPPKDLAREILSNNGILKSSGGVELKGSDAGFKPASSTGESQVPPAVSKRSKIEVIEGLKTELELAREFFSHSGVITPAPRPIPLGSILNTMMTTAYDSSASLSKDVGLDATLPPKPAPGLSPNRVSGAASGHYYVDTTSVTMPESTIADASPMEYMAAAATADALSSSQVKATRVPPTREVIIRLKYELELARKWKNRNGVYKPVPLPPITASSQGTHQQVSNSTGCSR